MILSVAQIIEFDASGGIYPSKLEILPIPLLDKNTNKGRFSLSHNAIEIICCIGWFLIFIIKFKYRKLLYSHIDESSNFIANLFIELVLIALTTASLVMHIKIERELTQEAVFRPDT